MHDLNWTVLPFFSILSTRWLSRAEQKPCESLPVMKCKLWICWFDKFMFPLSMTSWSSCVCRRRKKTHQTVKPVWSDAFYWAFCRMCLITWWHRCPPLFPKEDWNVPSLFGKVSSELVTHICRYHRMPAGGELCTRFSHLNRVVICSMMSHKQPFSPRIFSPFKQCKASRIGSVCTRKDKKCFWPQANFYFHNIHRSRNLKWVSEMQGESQ